MGFIFSFLKTLMLLVISWIIKYGTLFEMESLKLHFLQKDGQFIFGCNFVEIETVGFTADNFMANVPFLHLSNPRPVALYDVDLSVGEHVLPKLFY